MTAQQKKYSKSQRQLHKALLDLLHAKTYREITVTDLTAHADLSRATFYLYYQDKDTLLDEIIGQLAEGLTALMTEAYRNGLEAFYEEIVDGTPQIFVDYFTYFRRNSDIVQALSREGGGIDFAQRFDSKMAAYRTERTERWTALNTTDEKRQTKDMLYVSATKQLTDALIGWVRNGMEFPEELMAQHHARMWISYLLMLKGADSDISYQTIMRVLEKRGIDPDTYL